MLKYRSETGGSRAFVIREDQSNLHVNECVCVQSCSRINSVHSVLSCRNQLNIKNEDINEGMSALKCPAQSICSCQSFCSKILRNIGTIRTGARLLGGCSFIAGDLMESDIYLLKFLMKNTK